MYTPEQQSFLIVQLSMDKALGAMVWVVVFFQASPLTTDAVQKYQLPFRLSDF